eukprot:Awhi_evm1s10748
MMFSVVVCLLAWTFVSEAELTKNRLFLNLDREVKDAVSILRNEGGFGDPRDLKTYRTHGSHYSIVKDDDLDKYCIK